MKFLTVKHPWAAAILDVGKQVENRPFSTRHRGTIAIHVALVDDTSHRTLRVNELLDLAVNRLQPRGCIIGVVDIVDVHSIDECTLRGPCAVDEDGFSWAQLLPEPHRTLHHWILENPRELPTPIPYRGELGLRELSAEAAREITRQLTTKTTRRPPKRADRP